MHVLILWCAVVIYSRLSIYRTRREPIICTINRMYEIGNIREKVLKICPIIQVSNNFMLFLHVFKGGNETNEIGSSLKYIYFKIAHYSTLTSIFSQISRYFRLF